MLRTSRSILSAPILASLLMAVLAGCAPTQTPTAPPDLTLASPAVRGAQNGLEICAWPVDDRPVTGDGEPVYIRISEAIKPYLARPLPVFSQQAELWRAAGFRLVSVPIDDLELVRSRLRLVGPMNRQWLGQLPVWTPTIDGVRDRAGRTIALPEGPLTLGPGKLRLLSRCWTGPGEITASAVRPALQVEIVPQHEDRDPLSDFERVARGLPPRRPALESGLLFTRFVLSLTMEPASALFIIPESPDADWSGSDEPTAAAAGPPLPRPPSLGEATLSDAEFTGEGRAKLVVILIPRVPDEFHLLPEPR